MPENYGPAAFQSNTFQSNTIAFQLDHHDESTAETGNWTAQAPQTDGVTTQTPKTNLWTSQDEPNPTP